MKLVSRLWITGPSAKRIAILFSRRTSRLFLIRCLLNLPTLGLLSGSRKYTQRKNCRRHSKRPRSTIVRLTSSRERSEEHTSELQSHHDLVCRLLLEKKKHNSDRSPR